MKSTYIVYDIFKVAHNFELWNITLFTLYFMTKTAYIRLFNKYINLLFCIGTYNFNPFLRKMKVPEC